MFAIALGHPDCNDARTLADDSIHKILVGRSPFSGDPLASQSTLSRFENAMGSGELYRLVLKQGLDLGRLLKLPVWVEESVRRIVLHLPNTFRAKADWSHIAHAVGGASP